MCLNLFLNYEGNPLWFDSCKRPPPVSNHSVFTFWVVATSSSLGDKTISLYVYINRVRAVYLKQFVTRYGHAPGSRGDRKFMYSRPSSNLGPK